MKLSSTLILVFLFLTIIISSTIFLFKPRTIKQQEITYLSFVNVNRTINSDFSEAFSNSELANVNNFNEISLINSKEINVALSQYILESVKPELPSENKNFQYIANATSVVFLFREEIVRFNVVFVAWEEKYKFGSHITFSNAHEKFVSGIYKYFKRNFKCYEESIEIIEKLALNGIRTKKEIENFIFREKIGYLLKLSAIKSFLDFKNSFCTKKCGQRIFEGDANSDENSSEENKETITEKKYLWEYEKKKINVNSNDNLFFLSFYVPKPKENSNIVPSCVLRFTRKKN
ncbi:hypothetical protein EDEG_02583 [Edhazardia aedis USNM 41457]|uniref:Uncharacterized protein n=1 Tax=Edhazardia aedis (strain USNM 41457) TaxID=1003232 RepID=J8ZTN1_EDHAE|nr:hypothetical protein EDEG_02583 [Edhazardia aedis USNM 41457]|eukprot:EJW03033.1 hypothetical protein EDEG_02583 [Edhazardia aedis USNM 41457]